MPQQISYGQFGKVVKEKYPDLTSYDDEDVARTYLERHPELTKEYEFTSPPGIIERARTAIGKIAEGMPAPIEVPARQWGMAMGGVSPQATESEVVAEKMTSELLTPPKPTQWLEPGSREYQVETYKVKRSIGMRPAETLSAEAIKSGWEAKKIPVESAVKMGLPEASLWEQKETEKKLWEKFTEIFEASDAAMTAKALNVLAISKATGLSLSEISQPHRYEQLIRNPEITGIQPMMPTEREYIMGLMVPPILAGLLAHPVGTIAGLTAFGVLDHVIPTEKFIPTDANDTTKTAIELVDFIAKGAAIGGVFRISPRLIERFTKTKLTEFKLPEKVKLSKEQVKDIFQTERLTTAEQKDLFAQLELSREQMVKAVKEGVDIEIAPEKITRIVDKPYWAKLKSIFRIKPDEQIFREYAAKPKAKKALKALLEAPEPARMPSEAPRRPGEAIIPSPPDKPIVPPSAVEIKPPVEVVEPLYGKEATKELYRDLDRLRTGKIPKEKPPGVSLVESIRKGKGIDKAMDGGDIASMDPDVGRKSGQKKLLREKGGDALDDVAEKAVEDGYIKNHDINELKDAIGEELRGKPRYRLKDIATNEEAQYFKGFERDLRDKGIDVREMTNQEIRDKLISWETGKREVPDLGMLDLFGEARTMPVHEINPIAQRAIQSEAAMFKKDMLAGKLEERIIPEAFGQEGAEEWMEVFSASPKKGENVTEALDKIIEGKGEDKGIFIEKLKSALEASRFYQHMENLPHLKEKIQLAAGEEKAGLQRLFDEANSELIALGGPDHTKLLYNDEIAKEIETPPLLEESPRPTPPGELAARLKPLEDNIDKVIGETAIPMGLGIKITGAPAREPVPEVQFTDPETEKRFQVAKSGYTKEKIGERMGNFFSDLWHQVSRDFMWRLPRTAQHAKLRFSLLNLQKQKKVIQDKSMRMLQGLTLEFKPADMDLFTRKILLDDLREEIRMGHENLPFGFTSESTGLDGFKIDKVVEKSELMKKALESRRKIMEAVRDVYIEAMEGIGLNVRDKFTRKDYFRHQVLEYANLKSTIGTGRKLKTPSARGWLKQRKGSELDINVNYLETEFEVLSQMLYDTEVAKVLKVVEEEYNISKDLQQKARSINDSNMISKGYEKEMAVFKQRLGMAFGGIAKAVEKGEIPAELYKKWEAVIEGIEAKSELAHDDLGTPDAISPRDPNMFKFLADLANTEGEGAIWARSISKTTNARKQFKKDVLKDEYKEWEDVLPEDHSLWQPRQGNVFYMVDSIPARLAKQLHQKIVETIGITEKDLHKILSMGGPRTAWAIPTEVADTLNDMNPLQKDAGVALVAAELQRLWKINTLIAPRRIVRYNVRNLTGDSDALFVGNVSAFKKVPQAMAELYPAFFSYKTMGAEVNEWYKRGGFETLLRAQEIGDINDVEIFRGLYEKTQEMGIKPAQKVLDVFQSYWKGARVLTDYRESILRYACHLDYMEQLDKGKGIPANYGASVPEEIDAIPNYRDKAFRMSNELLGAYDEVGVMGQYLRKYIFPFWSWKEVNMKRYFQLFKNARADGKIAEKVGRTLGVKTPVAAWRTANFFIKASALWTALQVWNLTRYPEEERELDEFQRNRPHLIAGRDEDGRVRYFTGVGALGDALSWVGLDQAPRFVSDYLRGKASGYEIAKEMAKAPINVFVQGVSPLFKLPWEMATGYSFFPEVLEPRRIRNKPQYLFRQLALGHEFNAITGYPSKGYLDSLSQLLWYKQDPGQGAYNDIWSLKRKFLERRGKEFIGFATTPRSEALYLHKLALRFGDKEMAERYEKKYFAAGGRRRLRVKSLERMHPLGGLSRKEEREFKATFDFEDKKRLEKAVQFYNEILRGRKK